VKDDHISPEQLRTKAVAELQAARRNLFWMLLERKVTSTRWAEVKDLADECEGVWAAVDVYQQAIEEAKR